MARINLLSETEKLRLEVELEGNILLVRPVGVIDEDVNFSSLLQHMADLGPVLQGLRFDLGHINRMNSCGVREWLLLMERLPSKLSLQFCNVNELFIDQVNAIPNMFGRRGAAVLSFHAPYFCANCNADKAMLIEPQQVEYRAGVPVAPPFSCNKCLKPLEFNWIVEEYFSFLKRI